MSFAISPLSPVSAVGPTQRVSERVPAVTATTEAPGSRPREDRFDASGAAPTEEAQIGNEKNATADDTQEKPANGPKGQELTPDERQVVSELQLRDREVRAHEAAHKAAGGAAVGGASYTYQQGPDGRQYAIGGEVPVDLSTGGSPEAVIAKMEQVRAAALAPGEPSSQDQAVAAAADAIAAQARRELQATDEKESKTETADQSQNNAADQTTDGADTTQSGASPDLEPTAKSEAKSEGLINGRAIEAYRQAQDAQFAQGLINQRA